MSNVRGIVFEEGTIGTNTVGGDDSVSALVISTNVSPPGLALYTHTELFSTVDAEALGLDDQFDIDNNVNVFRHISEFFRKMGGRGELYLCLVDNSLSVSSIVGYGLQMLFEKGGKPRQIAFAFNMNDEVIESGLVYLDGLPQRVHDAIIAAQGLGESSRAGNFPVRVLVEGFAYAGPAASAADMRDLGYSAERVGLVIGQDWDNAEKNVGLAKKYADVGTALGCLAVAGVQNNMGENENPALNLTDVVAGVWKTGGLSSHIKISDAAYDMQTLEDKGYIFPLSYYGMDGLRWNSDPTCVKVVRDAEGKVNDHSLSLGRVQDKAQREIYSAMIIKVKTKHKLNAKGELPTGVLKYLEGLGDAPLVRMDEAEEISGGKTTIDPSSDLIVEKNLKVSFAVQPLGEIGEINATMNLKTKL